MGASGPSLRALRFTSLDLKRFVWRTRSHRRRAEGLITALLMSHGGKEGEFLCSLTSASRLLCLSLGSAAASCLIQVAGNAEARSRRW